MIPSKVTGGGNNSVAQNVLRIAISEALSSLPIYKMWDNSEAYPAVDPQGTTTIKEAFVGTTNNSDKPEYALVDTTSAIPSSDWLPANAVNGSANPNRMKGSVNYVTSPVIPTPKDAPDAPTATDSGDAGNVDGVVKYTVTFVVGTAGAPLGETLPSEEEEITVSNKIVELTDIPVGPAGTLYRRIYRTEGGGATGTGKLVTQINNNTATTYDDDVADEDLGEAQPTIDTSGSVRFNITAEFPFDSAVPSSSSQNILLEFLYQYTGSAPTLTYWYNEGTESEPDWVQFTPGTHGIRLVNVGTVEDNYKLTLPSTGLVEVEELWVTAD